MEEKAAEIRSKLKIKRMYERDKSIQASLLRGESLPEFEEEQGMDTGPPTDRPATASHR